MFELKLLTPEGIPQALDRVERYRLLNEPWAAASICKDILRIDPGNQEAIFRLILATTDQFGEPGEPDVTEARALIPQLTDQYRKVYSEGIICERKGTAILRRDLPGTGPIAHRWLTEAMAHYDAAERLRPQGNDDTITRWNTCARLILRHEHLEEASGGANEHFLE
jgi:hypothetical protein